FVAHGVRAQEFFRKKARDSEQWFDSSVKIFTDLQETGLIEDSTKTERGYTFEKNAKRIILIFEVLYIGLSILFFVQLISCVLKKPYIFAHWTEIITV
ncbi:MAG: hypothetical protein Q8N70_09630, partial [Deltaproteobacteria bacterium]|nr:hypothetical protein [Deltaproteobacteria bacterium]